MNSRLILALQVSPVDVFDGLNLIRLIADIQGEQRDDVEFAIVYRRDVNKYTLQEIAETAERAFKCVHRIKSKGFATGWPHGCNEMWVNGMTDFYRMSMNEKPPMTLAPAVLTFEADCVPLRPDWIDLLRGEWERCQKAKKHVIGHVHTFEHQTAPNHINGNAIFDIQIFGHGKGRGLQEFSATQGWDAFNGALLLELGMDTPYIAQKYRIKEINRFEIDAIRKQGHVPALFHGLKKSCGIQPVRDMIADGSFFDPERLKFSAEMAKAEAAGWTFNPSGTGAIPIDEVCGQPDGSFSEFVQSQADYSATSDAI